MQFPDPKWPDKPSRKLPKSPQEAPAPSSPSQSISCAYRVLGGLSWPEDGYPGFVCVVVEKPVDISKTFEIPMPMLEIVAEFQYQTITDLTKILDTLSKFKCFVLYTDIERANYTFVRDFNAYKRSSGNKISIKSTNSSSFEASLLQIRDFIVKKCVIFPANSTIKSQLATFSRSDIIHPVKFYAIRALCLVIGKFKAKSTVTGVEPVPDLRSWW